MRRSTWVVSALLGLGPAVPALGQGTGVAFDSGWAISGPGPHRVETLLGRRALRLRTARAVRRDVAFRDGTVDFDLLVTRARSFVYFQFRMTSDQDHEEIYFRPHKSDLPDAIQYTPVFRGQSAWQLYHGPGRTAAVTFRPGEWVHVRVVVQGSAAALFVGDTLRPALVIPRLARDPASGYIALRSFAVGGDERELVAGFANLVVRPGVIAQAIPPGPPVPPAPAGVITSWQVSPAFIPADDPARAIPDSVLVGRERWPTYRTDPEGRLVLDRYMGRPAPRAAAVARLVLRADRPLTRRLDLGFSDEFTLWLNGQPVAGGYAPYSFDNPRVDGLLTFRQATVYLSLRPGENEVLMLLADGFGGWGVMGSVDDH